MIENPKAEGRGPKEGRNSKSEVLTREQMIEACWRAFGIDGHNPESFREYLESRTGEQLVEMVQMLEATDQRKDAETPGREEEIGFQDLVMAELEQARQKHGNITGAHDAYGRILEEVDEFWEEVKEKHHSKLRMCAELVQIAAMCQRAAEDLNLPLICADKR